ncbi:restriction endonuclease subunit S [Chryseobacterium sp. ES2]|uniref:Restriction endonuclease subunit S n=1 Tax=Chryseobacterium metallicongregator TaxID=3073042 RepID=A0ABU1E8V0_9FLAO|nr:restriction endonuclease subunit S [Chryseobacterium sp. ES2]MDR4953822.1 restriction endonuclease subunit S [Chryseobacterium sp. ES2]
MTKKNKSVKNFPNLRFPEFEGEWKNKKLGEISDIYDGTHQTPKYTSNGVKFVSVENINDLYNTDKFISEKAFEKEYKIKPRKGDILMTRITAGIIGATAIVQNDNPLAYYVSLALIRIKTSDNINFLSQRIETKEFKNELHKRIIHVAFPKKINLGDIYECSAYFPEILEQQKIASFLSLINERIQTQKKIIEKLETLMKVSRTNIFSQKLRFKNEQGYDFPNWEKLKLGEIGNFQTSSIDKLSRENENEVYLVNYMNVYRHEDINSSTIKSFQKVTAKEQQISSCNLKKGDILFTPSSETPDDIGHSVVISENLENAVFSYHLMRFRPEIEIDILYSHYFCNVPIVLSQLSKFATGSTRFTISVKSFSDVEVSLPSLPEQKVIGKFISLIEHKIAIEKQI